MILSARPTSLWSYIAALMIGITFLLSAVLPVSAFTLSPQSVVLQSGKSQTIKILATETNTNGVSVKLSVSGLKISEFIPGDGLLNIGTCSNGTAYTDSELCVDLAAKDNFTSGQLLGTFTITKQGDSDGSLQIDSSSKYADGAKVDSSTVTVSSTAQPIANGNSASVPAPTTLADIAPFLIVGAIIILAIIVLLIIVLKSKSKPKSSVVDNPSSVSKSIPAMENTTASTALPPLPDIKP